MKKTLLITLLALLAVFSFAEIYTIGNGTLASNSTPVNGYYGYSWSKTIYTSAELGNAGLSNPAMITGIGFNVGNTPTNYTLTNQQIFMRSTNLTVQDNSIPNTANYMLTFNGTVVFNGGGWHSVDFTEPFQWDGTSNIEVAWINNHGTWLTGYPTFRYTQTTGYMASYAQADGSFPTGNGTLTYNRPNIQIHATQNFPDVPTLFVYPSSVDFGELRFGQTSDPINIRASNYGEGTLNLSAADVSISGTHAALFDIDTSNLPASLEMAENVQIPVTVTGSIAGAINATFTITYDGEDHDVPLSVNVLPQGIVDIGDGTLTQRFPFGHLYGYERSAAVYTMDDIGAVGMIQSIGWHCSASGNISIPYKIYAGSIDSNQVPSESFQSMTAGLTLVKQGNHTFSTTGWHSFELDVPVVYTGGNLLIAVENNYGGTGTGGYPYFYYTTSGQNSHAYWQQDNSQPTASGNFNALRPNLRLMMGDLTGDPQLMVNPQVMNFGTVFNGAQIGPRNITLANIGGGSLTVNPGDISMSGTHAAEFSYNTDALPVTLESAETAHIPVYVTGTTQGDISATITVNHASGTHNVALQADVLPPGIVIVGDGTATQRQPFGHVWGYERSASIYTSQEIGGVGMLHQVGWYCNSGGTANMPYKIYAGTTTQTAHTAVTFDQLTQDMQLVKQGNHHFTETGWNMFQLDMPIPYVGDNLMIAVEVNHGGSGGGTSPSFHYTSDSINSHMIWYADGNMPTGAGNLNMYRPNIMMALGELGGDPQLVMFPDAINFGEVANGGISEPRNVTVANIGGGSITLNEADVSFTGNHADLFSYDASVFPIVLDSATSLQIPIVVSGTTAGNVSANFNVTWGGETITTSLSATILPPGLVVIGTGTSNLKLPVNPFYGYSYTQQLYLQSEINMEGQQIEQIAFYWNGAGVGNLTKDWVVWMGHTSQNTLTSYIPISQMTQVFDGEVLATATPGWVTIELEMPFAYNNTDNLVIAVDENTPSYDGSAQFYYCTNATTSRALRYYNDGTNPDPTSPPAPDILQGFPNIRMLMSDVPDHPVLTYSPTEIHFGGAAFGMMMGPQNVLVRNIGAGTLTLTEDDVSFTGPQAAMFSYGDDIFPINLTTGQSAEISLFVMGNQEGPISANFVMNHNDEDHIVELAANVMTQGLVIAELGDGTLVNNDTGQPAPYGTWYRAFREQYLIHADELHNHGGGSGNIESIAFNVANLNTITPMTNYRIRFKHTNQTVLTTAFETGVYQQVFQAASFIPEVGWNTHIFQTPFDWDGTSNIIVDIVTDMCAGAYARNASTYFSTLTFNCTARWQSDSGSGDTATTASYLLMDRPNMKLAMSQLDAIDISAVSITGSTTPSVESTVTYTVRIRNLSPEPVSGYDVNLMVQRGTADPMIVDTAAGTTLQPMQTADIELEWTPTIVGEALVYGHVDFDEDENLNNNYTTPLIVTVMEAGLAVIQLGDGNMVNGDTGAPAPYGTWYRSFRQQFLYKADELYAMGAAPGLITALAFNVQSLDTCSPMPNYRIRVKSTNQTTLSTSFETGVYEQVFQSASFMPTVGWNMHAFSTPFIWNGTDNILVDIVTDVLQGNYTRNALTYFTTTPFNSSLRYQNDSNPGDTGTTGSTLTDRSNTRFYMIIDDMGSLSGTVLEDGYPVPNMLITVENTVFNTTTNQNGQYNFGFVPVGTQTVTASKNGYTDVTHTVVIEEDEETVQNFTVVGTPEFALSDYEWDFGDVTIGGSANKTFQIINAGGGELTINSITHSGSGAFVLTQPNLPVTLRSDQTLNLPISFTPAVLGEISATFTITDDQNNRYILTGRTKPVLGETNQATDKERAGRTNRASRDVHELIVSGNGVHSISIGTGTENARIPMDFYYRNSMYQTIFTSDELSGFIGMVTGIKLYNDFSSNLPSTPAKIWLGRTTQTNLSGGWISSNDLTLVYDGNLNLPSGQNTIAINFPEPFLFIEGGNMVLLMQRPYDDNWHSSADYFKCQTGAPNRARNAWSDSEQYNPTNMTAGSTTGQYPMITFEVIPGGVGHIEGIVRGEDGSPLSGVLVNLDVRTSVTSDANGLFYINNLLPNDYQLTLSRYGYLTQTIDVTIEEDVTEELDITMEEMPQVSILGTIVASDTGDGIADATLSFTGYADYSVTTNAAGEFIVDSNVYAYNDYDYTLTAAGYTAQTGTIEVGPQDYDMGVITMEELAFAPTQVAAEISPDYSSVNISWNPPDPDAFEIVESFEGVSFPPTDWTQTITNNGPPNMHGVRPTWSRFSVAEGVTPSDGDHQAGIAWIAEHQDEWLFSPGFTCPPDAYVRFDTHLEMGSEGGDHYYVKVSLNNGVNWEVLWDGAAQPTGLNSYDTPVTIDLTQYAGQEIKLAWHADDGDDAFGMWYNWYIDNVYIGNFVRTEQLSPLA
ncbi:MAG TPA: choice-of-anchor D domain-containing protein, partial [Candidatus Cloacimonetes bacterium]|nr:choice-of-anchor D domain-containing protein [Candidatus Cloacimonadota bacterium]